MDCGVLMYRDAPCTDPRFAGQEQTSHGLCGACAEVREEEAA